MRGAARRQLSGAEIDSVAARALKIYRPKHVEYGEVLRALGQGYDTVARLSGILVVEVQTMRRVMRALEGVGAVQRVRVRARLHIDPDEASTVDIWSLV